MYTIRDSVLKKGTYRGRSSCIHLLDPVPSKKIVYIVEHRSTYGFTPVRRRLNRGNARTSIPTTPRITNTISD